MISAHRYHLVIPGLYEVIDGGYPGSLGQLLDGGTPASTGPALNGGSPGGPLALREGRVTLDASAVPHVTADVTVPIPGRWELVEQRTREIDGGSPGATGEVLDGGTPALTGEIIDGGAAAQLLVPVWEPDEEVLEALDPRLTPRVRLAATRDVGGQTRVFDLCVRARTVDHGDGTLTLSLASDETLLQDFAPLVDDMTPLAAHANSLRSVVQYVLSAAIPDATLAPAPSTDVDVTPYFEVTNRVLNPRAESTWGYVAGTNTAAVNTGTTAPHEGARYVTWTSAAGGDANILIWVDNQVRPGDTLTARAHMRTGTAGHSMRLTLRFRDSEGNTIREHTSTVAPGVAPTWTPIEVTGRAPAGTAIVSLVATGEATAASQTYAIDFPTMVDGHYPVPAFHGNLPADSRYTYEWAGIENQSVSRRIPYPEYERDPESLIWKAGVPALDFLHPLLQTHGLRLVCDEERVWTLRDEAFEAPGALTLRHGVNLTDVQEETIDRNAELWFDARVTRYKWTDRDGIQQERVDSFALPGYTRVAQLEVEAAYPGPGRSEYAVRRAQGLGREITVSAVADWTARAEQPVAVTLPDSPLLRGNAVSVDFDLTTDEMTITTRTLEIALGSIDLLTGPINALTGTVNAL